MANEVAKKMIDLTGQQFGRLTVLQFDHFEMHGVHKRPYWLCRCDCGTSVVLPSRSLRSGKTRSCGCLRREVSRGRHYLGNPHRSKLHGVLRMVKKRCYDQTCEFYKNYGGRGVTVCDEWLGENGLDNFVMWAENNGYQRGLTLDRIDNEKGYSPDNCQWATRKHQSNNKRNNIYISLNGETKTLAQWCEYYGVPYARVEARYTKMGWTIEDALFTQRYKKPKGEYTNGKCSSKQTAEDRNSNVSCK